MSPHLKAIRLVAIQLSSDRFSFKKYFTLSGAYIHTQRSQSGHCGARRVVPQRFNVGLYPVVAPHSADDLCYVVTVQVHISEIRTIPRLYFDPCIVVFPVAAVLNRL